MTNSQACVIAQQYSSATFPHCALISANRNSALLTNAVSLNYFALSKIAKALNCVT
jgi:hypothetical protein